MLQTSKNLSPKKKNIYKKNYKKIYEKMSLLNVTKMSLLNFNFVMIHIIYKILVLIKNHMYYLQDNIFECFLKSIVDFYFF